MKQLVLGIECLVVDVVVVVDIADIKTVAMAIDIGRWVAQELVVGTLVAGMMPVIGILDLVEMIQMVANIASNCQHW